jgi:hypothetical protein
VGACGYCHQVAVGILPPGPAHEAPNRLSRRACQPPGGTPGSTAGRDACRYGAGCSVTSAGRGSFLELQRHRLAGLMPLAGEDDAGKA